MRDPQGFGCPAQARMCGGGIECLQGAKVSKIFHDVSLSHIHVH